MNLQEIKEQSDKELDKLHEDNLNLVDYTLEIDFDVWIAVLELDSELKYANSGSSKVVNIHSGYIQFEDFETELNKNYKQQIENYLNK